MWADKVVASIDHNLTGFTFVCGIWHSGTMHSKSQGGIKRDLTEIIEADVVFRLA